MKKNLDFYNECMKTGELPEKGLCGCALEGLISNDLLNLFKPTTEEEIKLHEENTSYIFWGYGLFYTDEDDCQQYYNVRYSFTPLRQTIVLFMAAMNNEL